MAREYIYHLWNMYGPEYTGDFEHMPRIYEVAFIDSDSEEEILSLRWNIESSKDGQVTESHEFEDYKIDIINTRIDSEIVRMITGKDKGEGSETGNSV